MLSSPLLKRRSRGDGDFLALLDLYPQPALLLEGEAVLQANARLLQLVGSAATELSDFVLAPERLRVRAQRAVSTGACTYDNFQLRQGGEIYYTTLAPFGIGGHRIVCCAFQNICEPEPGVLWSTLEKHPELRSTFFTQLPLGISQLNEEGDDFSWVYINQATRSLLASTLTVLLERRAKSWWLQHMLLLDEVGRFVRFIGGQHLFPEYYAAVSLKRIDDALNGAARFVWLVDAVEPSTAAPPTDAQKLQDLVKARTWQLEEALHAKERFLATMSHEIRTPLTGIMGALLLLADLDTSAEHNQILRIAQLCSEQLLVLINDVLDRAKFEEGRVELEVVDFDLHEMLADSMEILATVAAKKEIDLILDIRPPVPRRAMGDPYRLRQILTNLISNAVKFTKEGHVLLRANAKFSTSQRENGFSLCVDVEGIGISKVATTQVFQPFVQADQSMTRRFGGTGLGLSIAQRLAHLMDGKIWFDTIEGQGSCFHLVASLAFIHVAAAAPPQETPILASQRILVVVRSNLLRDLLSEQLIAWGGAVVAISTSTEALTLARGDFSLLVADINGRPDDGRLLQSFSLPTVLLRLGGEEERLKEVNERSAAILLFKPIRREELRRALLGALHRVHDVMPHPEAPPHSQQQQHTLHILLVEDNVANQLIVSRLLARLGQKNVTTVGDGKQAVDICRTTRFDLILMDIMMPEMNGWDATRHIRALGGTPVYIVALSANVFPEERQKCRDVGMDGLVAKPIQSSELERAVNSALELYHTLHNSVT